MDEALVEHASAKQLISELKGADPAGDLYDAKVTVLAEQIEHHVEEEEGSMFPKARYAGIDTLELGAAILARKSQLRGGDEALPATPPRVKATKRPARRKSSPASKRRPR